MVWKMRKLKAYLRPSLTTCCQNLFERTEEKRRRIRASDNFQFSSQFKLTAILRKKYPFNISKDNEIEKSREVLAAKWKSLVLTRARQREKTASCSGNRRRRRGCPFLILNSATPIQLRFRELCGGFYTTLRSPSKRISVKRSVTVFHRSSVYRCKHRIHQQVHIPNISW